MKPVNEKIRSLAVGLAAGLAGAVMSGLITSFSAASLSVIVPVFISAAIIVSTAHYWKTSLVRSVHDELGQVKNRLSLLGDSITETQGLVQLSGLNQPFPMPFGGSWALTPDAAAILAREIAIRRPNIIVELGSGVSTLMVGRLLQQMGHGRLVSLDHDPGWAEQTRRNILANGLQEYVEVLDAPLTRQQFDGKEFDWYQIPDQLRQIKHIDMLTVDGPPQTADTAILARYPALPAFAAQLPDHATIFIDDARRDTEQEMIEKWLQQYPGWKSRMIETIPGTCILEK